MEKGRSAFKILAGKTWSLTLREESMLRVFDNRILRRVLGPKTDDNGKWGRFFNEQLHSLYRSLNIVRVIQSRIIKWAGQVARIEKGRNAIKILTDKPKGNIPS